MDCVQDLPLRPALHGLEEFNIDFDVAHVFDVDIRRIMREGVYYIVCADVMEAVGYSTTGVAREFNTTPSYQKLYVPSRPSGRTDLQRPRKRHGKCRTRESVIAANDMMEWLCAKSKPFREHGLMRSGLGFGNSIYSNAAVVFEALVNKWYKDLRVNEITEDALDEHVVDVFEEYAGDIPEELESDDLAVFDTWNHDVLDILTDLSNIKREYVDYNAEVVEKRRFYEDRIGDLKSALMDKIEMFSKLDN
jgi:hypothetical protein